MQARSARLEETLAGRATEILAGRAGNVTRGSNLLAGGMAAHLAQTESVLLPDNWELTARALVGLTGEGGTI